MNDFSVAISTIVVIGLYGEPYEYSDVEDAIAGIECITSNSDETNKPLDGIRVTVIYHNEETIHGYFKSNERAKRFLERTFCDDD